MTAEPRGMEPSPVQQPGADQPASLIWTMVSPAVLWGGSEVPGPEYREQVDGHRILLLQRSGTSEYVGRLISTDPMDYLADRHRPGSLFQEL